MGEPLVRAIGESQQASMIDFLKNNGGDLLALGFNGAQMIVEHGQVVVRFTPQATRLLKANELRFMVDKFGKRLATLVGKSGKTVQNARLVGPLSKGTAIASNLVVAVVTAAHIISGADLAKKLKSVGKNVDFLVAAHRIDQLARVEGVYRQAKEILYLRQTDQARWELHQLGRELFEVRSAWRRELTYHLNNLHRKEESKVFFVRWFQGRALCRHDEDIADRVSAGQAEIQLINGSIAIHMALAQAAGTLSTFLEVSLHDEMEELKQLEALLEDRIRLIHNRHPKLKGRAAEACHHLADVRRMYSEMRLPVAELPAGSEV